MQPPSWTLTRSYHLLTNLEELSPLGNVPEADVGALGLRDDQVELVRHAVDPVHLVVGELHQPVLLLLKANVAPGPPLQPQLEDVIVTSALDHLDKEAHEVMMSSS